MKKIIKKTKSKTIKKGLGGAKSKKGMGGSSYSKKSKKNK